MFHSLKKFKTKIYLLRKQITIFPVVPAGNLILIKMKLMSGIYPIINNTIQTTIKYSGGVMKIAKICIL